MNITQKQKWTLENIKGSDHLEDQLTVDHILKLIIPSQLRDVIVGTLLLGQPIPKEVVPAFDQMMSGENRLLMMASYRNPVKRLEKLSLVKKIDDQVCPTCNGLKQVTRIMYNGSTRTDSCWGCNATGVVTSYKYIGPTI